jgi:stearoyl-CoA desaturase (delta-9 desaturase)
MISYIKKYSSPSVGAMNIYSFIAHIAFIYFVFTGNLQEWMIAIGVYLTGVTIGGTITLHRLLSHKSFKSPRWFECLGSMISTLGGSGVSTLAWVALHREHHRHTDQEKDPHSPVHYGYLHVQFRDTKIPNFKYVPDLARDKFHMFIHNYYWPIVLSYVTVLALIDPRAVLYFWMVPGMLVWHGGSAINTLNHSSWGYRNYQTKDISVNNFVTGYLVSGEGWHNNHHAQPGNPQFGHKWWEFDLGWQIIKLVRKDKENN